jgi:hypothetical protein
LSLFKSLLLISLLSISFFPSFSSPLLFIRCPYWKGSLAYCPQSLRASTLGDNVMLFGCYLLLVIIIIINITIFYFIFIYFFFLTFLTFNRKYPNSPLLLSKSVLETNQYHSVRLYYQGRLFWICIYVYTYNVCVCACTYSVYIYFWVFIFIYMYTIHIHIYVYAGVHIYIYVCVRMCMRECVYALMGGYVSMICGWMYINNIRMCISMCRCMRAGRKKKRRKK